jgi:UDP:flavonoid glycosyltransferase YjiC (YdhE family)
VLVAPSTSQDPEQRLLSAALAGLARAPVRVLASSNGVDPAVPVPANAVLVPWMSYARSMPAADVVVTHGGHGTVVRTLAAGVPMAILHHGRDQADNAARVVGRGAGLKIRRTANPERIAATVQRLLADPAYRTAAERLGASIRRDANDAVLLAELESVPQQPTLCDH